MYHHTRSGEGKKPGLPASRSSHLREILDISPCSSRAFIRAAHKESQKARELLEQLPGSLATQPGQQG